VSPTDERINAVTTTSGHRHRGLLLSLLTLLTLLGATLATPVDASASTRVAAETRVRAIDTPTTALIAARDLGSSTGAGVSSVWLRQQASATGVATNSADDVLRLGTKDSWGKLNTLDDHFARHGADFGATSADDYARQASEFLQRPGNLTKIDPKTGVIRVYDPATEAFGAYNSTGTTRTFYVPDPSKHGYPTNLDYWNAQPG
jgi:hypothetical protein